VVVFFDDALGQRQTQAPPTLFRRETGSEHRFVVFPFDAFACVCHINHIPIAHFSAVDANLSHAGHGIGGVFAEHLYHPLHQRGGNGNQFRFIAQVDRQLHRFRDAARDVFRHALHNRSDRLGV
jgi:hypothetical protein